jgi:hypothetical protein
MDDSEAGGGVHEDPAVGEMNERAVEQNFGARRGLIAP